ncbi:MAG: hypothetical protein ACP5K2_05970 [bacterium]
MNNILLYIFKVYITIIVLPGIILLAKSEVQYFQGYLIGFFLSLLDLILLYLTIKRIELNRSRIFISMILRVSILFIAILLMFVCGIINKLNIIGLVIALLLYPVALFIGGIRVLRWKR